MKKENAENIFLKDNKKPPPTVLAVEGGFLFADQR